MKPFEREHSLFDDIVLHFDQGLRAICGATPQARRQSPAASCKAASLSPKEQEKVAAMMRVNHCGEVCAQALYQGQSMTAGSKQLKLTLRQSAEEENDHLHWCQQRLDELNSHVSYLNPLWYSGSLVVGMAAGLAGDPWNLGFLEETEKQVATHLKKHLKQLPKQDEKTKKILEQMHEDELHHATVAVDHGAKPLPKAIKKLMKLMSKVMTKTAEIV